MSTDIKCDICKEEITKDEMKGYKAVCLNPKQSRSPVVSSKWAHKNCISKQEEE